MIIAVDFDGTCVKHRYPMVGEDVDGAVSVLKELVWVLKDPEHRVRFSDDDIRNMLGKHQAPEREVLVSAMKRQFIITALKKCYDVVIDGTLKPHENDFVRRCVKAHNSTVDELRSLGKLSPQDDTRYSIEYKDSIVPLQESTDEDATTATYKKTYKFIGTW